MPALPCLARDFGSPHGNLAMLLPRPPSAISSPLLSAFAMRFLKVVSAIIWIVGRPADRVAPLVAQTPADRAADAAPSVLKTGALDDGVVGDGTSWM